MWLCNLNTNAMSIIIPDTLDQNSYLTWRRETKKRAKEDTIKNYVKAQEDFWGVFTGIHSTLYS